MPMAKRHSLILLLSATVYYGGILLFAVTAGINGSATRDDAAGGNSGEPSTVGNASSPPPLPLPPIVACGIGETKEMCGAFYCFFRPLADTKLVNISSFKNLRCTHLVYGYAKVGADNNIRHSTSYDDLRDDRYDNYHMITSFRYRSPNPMTMLYGVRLLDDSTFINRSAKGSEVAMEIVWWARHQRFNGIYLDIDGALLNSSHFNEWMISLNERMNSDGKAFGNRLSLVLGLSADYVPWFYKSARKYNSMVNAFYLIMDEVAKGADPTTALLLDPLHPTEAVGASYTIEWAAKKLASSPIPKHKIIIGLSAWARSYVVGRHTHGQAVGEHGAAALRFGRSGRGQTLGEQGRLAYDELCSMPAFKEAIATNDDYYDAASCTNSFVDNANGLWYSFNTPKQASLGRKLKWITSHGYGGVGLYSIQGDDLNGRCDSSSPLPLHNAIAELLQCPKHQYLYAPFANRTRSNSNTGRDNAYRMPSVLRDIPRSLGGDGEEVRPALYKWEQLSERNTDFCLLLPARNARFSNYSDQTMYTASHYCAYLIYGFGHVASDGSWTPVTEHDGGVDGNFAAMSLLAVESGVKVLHGIRVDLPSPSQSNTFDEDIQLVVETIVSRALSTPTVPGGGDVDFTGIYVDFGSNAITTTTEWQLHLFLERLLVEKSYHFHTYKPHHHHPPNPTDDATRQRISAAASTSPRLLMLATDETFRLPLTNDYDNVVLFRGAWDGENFFELGEEEEEEEEESSVDNQQVEPSSHRFGNATAAYNITLARRFPKDILGRLEWYSAEELAELEFNLFNDNEEESTGPEGDKLDESAPTAIFTPCLPADNVFFDSWHSCLNYTPVKRTPDKMEFRFTYIRPFVFDLQKIVEDPYEFEFGSDRNGVAHTQTFDNIYYEGCERGDSECRVQATGHFTDDGLFIGMVYGPPEWDDGEPLYVEPMKSLFLDSRAASWSPPRGGYHSVVYRANSYKGLSSISEKQRLRQQYPSLFSISHSLAVDNGDSSPQSSTPLHTNSSARPRRTLSKEKCSVAFYVDHLLAKHYIDEYTALKIPRPKLHAEVAIRNMVKNKVHSALNVAFRTQVAGIKFRLKRIVVYDPASCQNVVANRAFPVEWESNLKPHCKSYANGGALFTEFAEIDHSAYCLAYFIAYRGFADGDAGLGGMATQGTTTPKGGACSPRALGSDGKMYSRNGVMIDAMPSPLLKRLRPDYKIRPWNLLNTICTHETAHALGAVHDGKLPGQAGCSPFQKNSWVRQTLMAPSVDVKDFLALPHTRVMSQCTKDSIREFLKSFSDDNPNPTRHNCLTYIA